MDAAHWYAINTKPHQEKRAESRLGQFDIETFLPLVKQKKVIRRVRRVIVEPLFPGYLFARFDLEEHYRTVTYARGVRTIVEFGSRPAEVDAAIIEGIRQKLDQGYLAITRTSLGKGQVVQVQNGPLSGLEAVFVREMPGEQRAMLLLQNLAFHARVVINIDHIAPIRVA